MNRYLFASIAAAFAVIAIHAQVPAEWPVARQQILDALSSGDSAILNAWDRKGMNTLIGNDDGLANSNRGYALIDSSTQKYLYKKIDTMLMSFQKIGYKIVCMDVHYPMLVAGFPNAAKYLDFYKTVAAKIRSRGMTIMTGVQPIFIDSVFGEPRMTADVVRHYTNPDGNPATDDSLTNARYIREKIQMMQTVIDSIGPDYLTMEMEPQTCTANTMRLVNFSPDSVKSMVDAFCAALKRRSTKLAAGAGTWDSFRYFDLIGKTSVDIIDFHLYPVSMGLFAPMVLRIDSLARATHKGIIMSEGWCYKETITELQRGASPLENNALAYSRNVFDYWYDIDTVFVHSVFLLAQEAKIQAMCFFWPSLMNGQLAYSPTLYGSMAPPDILNTGLQAGYAQMYKLQLSPIGMYTQKAIAGLPMGPTLVQNHETPTGCGELYQNYPNPFNPSTTIEFSLGSSGPVTMEIIDVLGRIVATPVAESLSAGGHRVEFDGRSLASGMYYCRLKQGSSVYSRKMLLLR